MTPTFPRRASASPLPPATLLIGILFLCSCGSESGKGGDSPEFAPGTVVTVKGVFLGADGKGLPERRVSFRNLRRQGYVDSTAVTVDEAARALGSVVALMAWPFYWFYSPLGLAPPRGLTPEETRVARARPPAYFLESVLTDAKGAFRFRVDESRLLRDQRGGIHVALVNDKGETPLFGKFAFTVKGEDTDLGAVRLCSVAPRVEEGENDVVVRWDAFPVAPKKLFVTLADARDNALLWSVEVKAGDTSVSIPKAAAGNRKAKAAIEAFTVFEEASKTSCLSGPVEFTPARGSPSLAAGRAARVEGVEFLVTSLTNGSLADPAFFEPFDTRRVTFDLGAQRSPTSVALHNLKLRAAGTGEFLVSSNGTAWEPAVTFPEARFVALPLPPSKQYRYVRLVTSSPILDLQEASFR